MWCCIHYIVWTIIYCDRKGHLHNKENWQLHDNYGKKESLLYIWYNYIIGFYNSIQPQLSYLNSTTFRWLQLVWTAMNLKSVMNLIYYIYVIDDTKDNLPKISAVYKKQYIYRTKQQSIFYRPCRHACHDEMPLLIYFGSSYHYTCHSK